MFALPLEARHNILYQQGGWFESYFIAMQEWLDNHFPIRWSRRKLTPWKARNTDLTPMDFHIYRHTERLLYDVASVPNVKQLIQRIIDEAEQLKTLEQG